MPELPEVELVRRHIKAMCLKRRIDSLEVLDSAILDGVSIEQMHGELDGHEFTRAERHGKQLFLKIGKGWMTVHLGMTGNLTCMGAEHIPPRFTRLHVHFLDGGGLIYEDMRKFGSIGLARTLSSFIEERGLGPDALNIDEDEFIDRVSRHKRNIKTVLLDQSVLAGVGNLYSDEILFQCKIHPLALSSSLSTMQMQCLHREMQRILKKSIQVMTDFDRLPKDYMLKNRRPSAHCPNDHGPWQTIKINGRTTYLCPRCQRF